MKRFSEFNEARAEAAKTKKNLKREKFLRGVARDKKAESVRKKWTRPSVGPKEYY